jgi:hypothetical protein
VLASLGSDLYTFDNQDLTHDLVISASLMYGKDKAFYLAAGTAPGVFPSCSWVSSRSASAPAAPPTRTVQCVNASWMVRSQSSAALLRISARAPCNPPGLGGGACIAARDWVAGPLNIVAFSSDSAAAYSISVSTGSDPTRLLDGYPLDFTQSADDAPIVLMFSTDTDPLINEVRAALRPYCPALAGCCP